MIPPIRYLDAQLVAQHNFSAQAIMLVEVLLLLLYTCGKNYEVVL